jgi:hypothetical protein
MQSPEPRTLFVVIVSLLFLAATNLIRFTLLFSLIIMSGFDISKESTEGYCKVAEGVYMTSEADFYPGGASHTMPCINNRAFVFEVKNKKGVKHLLMSGLPGKSEIDKVRKIEKDVGLKVTIIVASGDFHHLSMKMWLEAFPETKFIHSALKFPTTRNGKDILANETWKKQIELVEGPEIESLKEYEDTLKFVAFNQFKINQDGGIFAKDADSPPTKSGFAFLKEFASEKPTLRMLAVWVYHVPTKQLLYEHNFAIFFSKAQIASAKYWLIKFALPKEKFGSLAKEALPRGPSDPEGCRIHCETMQKIIELDVVAAMDYHSDLGCQCKQWSGKEEWTKNFTAILAKTGEDVADGSKMVKAMKPSRCSIM